METMGELQRSTAQVGGCGKLDIGAEVDLKAEQQH